MKKNFKAMISLVLTVLMLMGTVSAIIPLTVSAEGTEIARNTDYVVNGITYRFDPVSSNTYSKAVVNPDNTITLTMKQGDLFWVPSVTIGNDSVLNMKVTLDFSNDSNPTDSTAALNKGQIACGLAYNIDAGSNGVWSESSDNANVLNIQTKLRVRVGNGTVSKFKSGSLSTTFVNSTISSTNDAANRLYNVSSSSPVWQKGTAHEMNLQMKDDTTVVASFRNDESIELKSLNYTVGTNTNDEFEGPVGFAVNWSGDNSDDGYLQVTINSFEVTNAIVGGQKVNFSLFETVKPVVAIDLVPNADNWINGQNYRFETKNADSYAKIENGKLVLKISAGDLFWIPTLTVKDATSAYSLSHVTTDTDGTRIMIVNNIATGKNMYGTGIAYNGESVWVVDRQMWSGNGIDISSYDKHYKEIADWGGTARPVDGNWKASEILNVKTTFETTEKLVPRVSFKEGANNTYNMITYPSLSDGAGGMSFGISLVNASALITIDKITATNMNGVDSYVETFFEVDTTAPVSVSDERMSLTLDGTIGLNFVFNASNLAGATVVATKNGETVASQAVVNGENLITAPVNAKEMNDDVTFSIMVDGEVYDGKTYTASVKEYADKLMADDNFNAWDDLMTAMLKYGAAAQKLLDYKADEADVSGIEYDFSGYEAVITTGDKNILKGLYMSLSLESDTVLNLYMMPADGTAPVVTVDGVEAELVDNGDGYYVLSISGVAADELDNDFEIVVNGGLSFAVNALDWARIASEGADADMATLAKALATYADAANAMN